MWLFLHLLFPTLRLEAIWNTKYVYSGHLIPKLTNKYKDEVYEIYN
jgi:hypothetical protein